MHSQQMTLHDMFKQENMNPNFCLKIFVHLTGMHT